METRYILSYEYQPYASPTPMELDIEYIKSIDEHVEFTVFDDGHSINFETKQYIDLSKLKSRRVFTATNGDEYSPVGGTRPELERFLRIYLAHYANDCQRNDYYSVKRGRAGTKDYYDYDKRVMLEYRPAEEDIHVLVKNIMRIKGE